MQVSSPRVPSGSASQTTLRRRSSEMVAVRKRVSGGQEMEQKGDEVKAMRKEDRSKLIDELKRATGCFQVVITPQQSLAMKADLQIPWNKLRLMRRLILVLLKPFSHVPVMLCRMIGSTVKLEADASRG